ncbi:MAG: glycosyltransferase [Acidimicrobiia bacterium]|nr:glycosyltransferase [Acidimicrobiia bacterium]
MDDSTPAASPSRRVASIGVYVCTHRRNGPLRRVLDSLADAAVRVQPDVEVAVVVVDDNPDGRAKEVVDAFDGASFLRGLHYRYSGAQNISKARNLGLESAMELADWVAMTDDDEVVSPQWLAALAEMAERPGVDAVTGPVELRYPPGTPRWFTEQPFDDILVAEPQPDGARVEVCSTGNSMLRASFLREHPDIRFRSDLGTVGGEDMVFYRTAVAAGLEARFASAALCWCEQPSERTTYRSIIRGCWWMGNTEYVTSIETGEAKPFRLALRGGKKLAVAVLRPVRRLAAQQNPQLRFAGASVARALGTLVGLVGVRVEHK